MSQINEALFENTLRSSGYSLTKPRRVVFNLFLKTGEPQTMAQLVQKSSKDIDRASLYRTIRLFEDEGIVRRIAIGWKYKLELDEKFSSHHHHMYCRVCGKIIDIKEPPQLGEYITRIAYKHGFQPMAHTFEIEGVCRDCLNRVENKQ